MTTKWTLFVGLFLLSLPFQFALNISQGFDVAIVRVVIVLTIFYWIAQSLLRRRIMVESRGPLFAIILFLVYTGISVFFSQEVEWSFRKWLFLATVIPFYFVLSSLFLEKRLHGPTLLRFALWSGFIVSCVALFQFLLQFVLGLEAMLDVWRKIAPFFLGETFSQSVFAYSSWLVSVSGRTIFRAIAFFPDPHILSFFLETLLFLPLFLFMEERKGIYMFMFFAMLSAILCTFSRGAYIGILASGIGVCFSLLFASESGNRFRQKAKEIIAFLFFVAIISFVFWGKPVYQRLESSFDTSEGSNVGRMNMWFKGWDAFSCAPLLGLGLGNFASFVEPSADYRKPIYAHNLYLDIAVETGIIGLLLWGGWFFGSLYSTLKASKKYAPLLGVFFSLIAFSVHAFFDTPLFSIHVLSLLCFLLSIHLAFYEKRNSDIGA